MAKPELSPSPLLHIRYCPAELFVVAAEVGRYGIAHYSEWPNNDCIMTFNGYVWYWRCSRAGNVTVFYNGEEATDE